MTTFGAGNVVERVERIAGTEVRVRSYKVGERFACHIDNIDPGTVIARAQGDTRSRAEEAAIEQAMSKLKANEGLSSLRKELRALTSQMEALGKRTAETKK